MLGRTFALLLLGGLWGWIAAPSHAQLTELPLPEPIEEVVPAEDVDWPFPAEVELAALVDFVAQQLGYGMFYDDTLADLRVTIRTRQSIQRQDLRPLLDSALAMKGFVLADAELPGWKRVISRTQLTTSARLADQATDGTGPLTAVLPVEHLSPQAAIDILRSFLTTGNDVDLDPDGEDTRLQTVPGKSVILVTELGPTVARLKRLLAQIDRPGPTESVELIVLQHTQPSSLAQQVTEMITTPGQPTLVRVVPFPRAGQLALMGPRAAVQDAKALVTRLDVAATARIERYPAEFVDVQSLSELVAELVADQPQIRVAPSPSGDALVVRADDRDQTKVASIIEQVDVQRPAEQSRVRFHQLRHTTAFNILLTMQQLQTGNTVGGGYGYGWGAAGGMPAISPFSGYAVPLGAGSLGYPTNFATPLTAPWGGTTQFPGRVRGR